MKLPKKRVFLRTIALAIGIAHLVVVVAAATESWHGSASAHVEQGGTQRHYAHNDASCPICTAQSMHARIEMYLPPSAVLMQHGGALVGPTDRPSAARAS
jgi:hypothetical protein